MAGHDDSIDAISHAWYNGTPTILPGHMPMPGGAPGYPDIIIVDDPIPSPLTKINPKYSELANDAKKLPREKFPVLRGILDEIMDAWRDGVEPTFYLLSTIQVASFCFETFKIAPAGEFGTPMAVWIETYKGNSSLYGIPLRLPDGRDITEIVNLLEP